MVELVLQVLQEVVDHRDQVVLMVELVLQDLQDQVDHQDQVVVLEITVLIVESGDMIIHLLQHQVLIVLVLIILQLHQ